MKKILMIIPLLLLYSCGTYITTITANANLLTADKLNLTYRAEKCEIPLKDREAYYTYEYKVPGIGADTLYSVSRLVMPDIFRSAESVIQMEDATLKTIVGKGLEVQTYTVGQSMYSSSFTHNVYYTMRIQCYNGKIKISVYNLHSRNHITTRYLSTDATYYLSEAITKGVNEDREILDNIYGAFIFAVDDTGREVINIFVNTAEKYLKENFNIE